jgi:hypothetical protein
MRHVAVALTLLAALGCSGMGGPPSTPIAWTPGRYAVEATLGESLSATEVRAQLTIAPDHQMRLDSSTGLCQPRTQADIDRDLSRGQATFACGEATFRFRPIPGGVRGDVRGSVLEEYQAETSCPPGRAGPCYIMRTRQVVKSADLTVNQTE